MGDGKGGDGGNASVSGKGLALGGRAGGSGPKGAPSGGRGGDGHIEGDGVVIGGEGGEAGQVDRGGRGGHSPIGILEEMGLLDDGTKVALLVANLREECIASGVTLLDGDPMPEHWVNERLALLGLNYRYEIRESGFTLLPL